LTEGEQASEAITAIVADAHPALLAAATAILTERGSA